jgi:hypothetical protein
MKANTKVAIGRASGKSRSLTEVLKKRKDTHKDFHELIHVASLWYKEFSHEDSFIPYTEGDTQWWCVDYDWDEFSFKYLGDQTFSVSINDAVKDVNYVIVKFTVPDPYNEEPSSILDVQMMFPFQVSRGKEHFIDKIEMHLAWDFMVRTSNLPFLQRTRKFKRVEKYFKELCPHAIMNYMGRPRSPVPDRRTFMAAVALLLMGGGDL